MVDRTAEAVALDARLGARVTLDRPPQLEAESGSARVVRVHGLNRACETVHRQFEASLSLSGEGQAAALRSLGATIHTVLEIVGVACERSDVDPHDFPVPARQAFAWLGLLADPEYRRAHLLALRAAASVDARVRTRFYNSTALYRLTPRAGLIHLTAHEAFVGAPEEVLRALVRLGVPYSRKRAHRARLTRHTETAEFQSALEGLDRFNRQAEAAGLGGHFELAAVFARVNQAYFDGRMARPNLAWSRGILRQEFGRYESSRDTVMLNRALDRPEVPELVVEYVLYHELLTRRWASASRPVGGRSIRVPSARRSGDSSIGPKPRTA